jgi:RNA polymerase-binding transcription factor DksA
MSTSDVPDPSSSAEPTAPESLDRLADDLAGVERALERLEDGSYWTDEVTGEALPDELLATDPTARRAAPPPADASGG